MALFLRSVPLCLSGTVLPRNVSLCHLMSFRAFSCPYDFYNRTLLCLSILSGVFQSHPSLSMCFCIAYRLSEDSSEDHKEGHHHHGSPTDVGDYYVFSPEVTPSPEDLFGRCSISPLLSQTILNIVVAALIFLQFLSSAIQV